MPDDIKVVAGLGDDTVAPPVATDLIAGRHYQKIKVGWGVDGTFNETADVAGARIPIADPVQIASNVTDNGIGPAGSNGQLVGATAGLRFTGFSLRETTGTAGAIVVLRHGNSTGSPALVTISLGAGESAREWYGPDGMLAASGVFVERVSGSSHVIMYWKQVS